MGNNLYNSGKIKETNSRYGFTFSKSLGQNFLTDYNIINKIIEDAEIFEDDLVIEIGPGSGVLTEQIAEMAKCVVAIELDKRLIPILQENLNEYKNIKYINDDVLKVNLQYVISEVKKEYDIKSVKVIGNLPYYITTPIIMKILKENIDVDSITVMMQKEVADRIMALPKTKAYGALSVAVQYYCDVHKVTFVPKEAFIPRPKVDSEVIRLDLKKEKDVQIKDLDLFFKVVKAGFGMRRKTLLNSLTLIDGMSKDKIKEALEDANIDSTRRAETLTIEEFAILTEKIKKLRHDI